MKRGDVRKKANHAIGQACHIDNGGDESVATLQDALDFVTVREFPVSKVSKGLVVKKK